LAALIGKCVPPRHHIFFKCREYKFIEPNMMIVIHCLCRKLSLYLGIIYQEGLQNYTLP
jgi:hypothetical protein